jgi:outer membrane protein OmpA-like peptidoglycan-associated protein
MIQPGLAQPPGGVTLHRSSPARLVLAVGLFTLGIGDLAVIHRVLLPRYFAEAEATRMAAPAGRAALVAVESPAHGLPAAPVAVTSSPAIAGETPAAATPPPVAPPPPSPAPVVGAAAAPAEPAVALPAAPAKNTAPAAAKAVPPEEFPDLLFAINTTWLSRASRETLDKVVAALEADASRRVILSGHTDAAGPSDLNRALARARARRASRYLRDHGIDRARVEIQSFGAQHPAEDVAPGAMRARNRRVEISME